MIISTVTGNIGKNASLRQTEGGPVLGFNVASNTKERGAEVTTWVECSLWGTRGEKLAQYLTKGKKIAVGGEMSHREYDGKTIITMRVSGVDFMGGRGEAGGGQRREQPRDDYGEPASDDSSGEGPIPF